ncbi:MAG: thymidylate kinase [Candidatus Pacearchaeota archaeon]|nr:thymidylate kinase [Candidatus Pacearchaeota archaeon]
MKKGKIILIEGTDGSGKNTQAHLLLVRLNREGIPCKLMSFPRYHTPTGRIVGQSYLGKEKEYWSGESGWFLDADGTDPKIASLYYAADRRAAIKDILKIINSGQNLILDRYYTSNMAHQGGKLETLQEREKMFKWIETLELDLLDIPKEDLTIFLHMPLNVSAKLREKRENITSEVLDAHEENISHIKRAEDTYCQLAKRSNWKTIECAPEGNFESLKTPGIIHEEVYEIVKNYFLEKPIKENNFTKSNLYTQ